MTALEFNSQFYAYMAEISVDEVLSEKLLAYMKKLVTKKKDPTEMTHEEFLKRVDEAAKGEVYELKEGETVDDLIKSLGL